MRNGSNSRRPRGRNNNNGRRNNNGRSNTVYDSNGPTGRIRGTAQQVYDKYMAQASDAVASDDKVLSESMYQHAEHYLRVLLNDTDIDYETYRQEQDRKQNSEDQSESDDDANTKKTTRAQSKSSDKDIQENSGSKASAKEKDRMTDVPGFLAEQPKSASKPKQKQRELEAEPA